MAQDALGNEVGANSAVALAGIDDFVTGFLGYEKKAANIIAAADAAPEAPLAQIYAGFTWMFLEAESAPGMAATYLGRVRAETPRERMLQTQLERWIAGDIPAALAIGEEIVRGYPRDLASVKLHQYFSFNRGDAASMLKIAKLAEPANPKNAHLLGMMAFAHEQLNDIPAAEAAARQALEFKRKEPWAQHALAHVMLSSGRVREGVDFLDDASGTWVDLNSFMYTHNWWHKALFHISLGDHQAVFDAYDNHVWGIEPEYSQDQAGAVSLLARMEVAGMNVGDRWQGVADYLKARATDTVQPFLTLQYLYGLARAERAEADRLMQVITDKAMTSTAFDRLVWRDVALPAARGMLAHARRSWVDAARWLGEAHPRMTEIGGSHAQRDLFGQLLLDAQMKIGNWPVARHMLEMRRTWDPDGVPVNRALARVYCKLGMTDEARAMGTRFRA
jgi:tetratricopeptide (TPR) repeat protein